MISCGFLARLKREFSPHFARLLASLCDEAAGGGYINSRSGDITLVLVLQHTASSTSSREISHWCLTLALVCVWLGVIPLVATFYQVSFIGHTSANNPSLHCHHNHHDQHDHHHHPYVRADLARCIGEMVIGQAGQWQVDRHTPRVIIIAILRLE